jgi:hypothetical protein
VVSTCVDELLELFAAEAVFVAPSLVDVADQSPVAVERLLVDLVVAVPVVARVP